MHFSNLREKLEKDSKWDNHQYEQIEWEAHRTAILSLPCSHKTSISKLSHKLWNTNKQNSRFYHEPNMCPSCLCCPETWHHVFSCQNPRSIHERESAQEILLESLTGITPPLLLSTIMFGISQWSSHPNIDLDPTTPDIPSVRSLQAAFSAQTDIGWGAFLRGHLCTKWAQAFLDLYKSKNNSTGSAESGAKRWKKKLIISLWTYRKAVGSQRNAVVHGKNKERTISKKVQLMHTQAISYYAKFTSDNHCIPVSRRFLFNDPLDTTLSLLRPALKCWLLSVEEALSPQRHRDDLTRKQGLMTLDKFLVKRAQAEKQELLRAPFSTGYYRNLQNPMSRTHSRRDLPQLRQTPLATKTKGTTCRSGKNTGGKHPLIKSVRYAHNTPRTSKSNLALRKSPKQPLMTNAKAPKPRHKAPRKAITIPSHVKTLLQYGFGCVRVSEPQSVVQQGSFMHKKEHSGTLLSTVP